MGRQRAAMEEQAKLDAAEAARLAAEDKAKQHAQELGGQVVQKNGVDFAQTCAAAVPLAANPASGDADAIVQNSLANVETGTVGDVNTTCGQEQHAEDVKIGAGLEHSSQIAVSEKPKEG